MNCPSCNAIAKEEYTFCNQCGFRLIKVIDPIPTIPLTQPTTRKSFKIGIAVAIAGIVLAFIASLVEYFSQDTSWWHIPFGSIVRGNLFLVIPILILALSIAIFSRKKP
ncbi:MAG: hypothetical protein FWC69_01550 [Defluviitaleaceae bacterium]|nr:hypothetical protein [Defluviitaleaceae bacterium]